MALRKRLRVWVFVVCLLLGGVIWAEGEPDICRKLCTPPGIWLIGTCPEGQRCAPDCNAVPPAIHCVCD